MFKKKNQKYGVIIGNGFTKVNMTPELADKLAMYSPSPLLIIGKK